MNTTLRENIDWVGYVDWNVRDFHGYNTDRGATYNAYLVRDEKTALIDTVKAPFAGALLAQVAALVDLSRVDYVVCNHAEPDHAGGLPEVLQALPNATLVADAKCLAALAEHFDTSAWKTRTVADGETLSLGRRTMRFIETPDGPLARVDVHLRPRGESCCFRWTLSGSITPRPSDSTTKCPSPRSSTRPKRTTPTS